MDDAKIAIDTGVDGIDVVFGTSSFLREFSHGKDIPYIIESAIEVIEFVKSQGLEVRFSSEDSFRSDLVDLLTIYRGVDKTGVNRVGIADTVGVANPRQVYELIKTLRGIVSCDIEFHGHNDTGCAVANAYCALEAGATHVDTSVLGIGERNGITSLGGLVARMYAYDKEGVRSKYNLPMLREVENFVAGLVEVDVPFNNYITGYTAFTHKADFGLTRYIHVAHRLTGWNAIKERADQLQLEMSDDAVKKVTAQIKAMADQKRMTLDDVDYLLRAYHSTVVDAEAIEKMENI
jgi:homocitrate synthase